jgi:hypothetical protein
MEAIRAGASTRTRAVTIASRAVRSAGPGRRLMADERRCTAGDMEQ